MMQRAFQRVPRDELYHRTGIQFLPFNTVFQLLAVAAGPTPLLDAADRLLMMPDLFAYWLTGAARSERSIASTSQLLNPHSGQWDRDLCQLLDIPARILPDIVPPGTVGETLRPEIAEELGQRDTPLVYTACHDTAAAVAAVPATGQSWAYISSGTWSLVGVELPSPCINSDALRAGFTNEAGVSGTIRFLKNVTGLWLVQECQRTWAAEDRAYTHEQLADLARQAPALRALVDPDDPRFLEPGDMPRRIRAFCRETQQSVPDSPGAVVRCALESLALKCRLVLAKLEQLTARQINVVHVVGGGSQNTLLSQFIANATAKPVVAGPIETTAAGNVMAQAMAQGRVASLTELRQVIAHSAPLQRYGPADATAWTDAAERFARLQSEV